MMTYYDEAACGLPLKSEGQSYISWGTSSVFSKHFLEGGWSSFSHTIGNDKSLAREPAPNNLNLVLLLLFSIKKLPVSSLSEKLVANLAAYLNAFESNFPFFKSVKYSRTNGLM